MARKAASENGPVARSFAADAHGCIMVWPQVGRPHTSLRRDDRRPARASSPPIVTHPTKTRPCNRASSQGGVVMTSRLTQAAPYKFLIIHDWHPRRS